MARTKEDAQADKLAAEATATPARRGRPAKGTSAGVKKAAYVPTGKPRGRPPGNGPKKEPYVPTGKPRGRPKVNTAEKAAKVQAKVDAMAHARAQKGKNTPVKGAKPRTSTGGDATPKGVKGRRVSKKVEQVEEEAEDENVDKSEEEDCE